MIPKFINKDYIVFIFYVLFAVSLPFNGFEYDILGITRFEIKITMFTFMFMCIVWIYTRQNYKIILRRNEIIIYYTLLVYVVAQYISINNSIYPFESFQQSIVITCLAAMLIISAQLTLNSRIFHIVYISIGITCFIIAISSLYIHYFYNYVPRLGQIGNSNYSLSRGDPTLFGDMILYGMGSVYYIFIVYCRKKYQLLLTVPVQIILCITLANTYSKGVLLSVCVFYIVCVILLKGERIFMLISSIIFIFIVYYSIPFNNYISSIKTNLNYVNKSFNPNNLYVQRTKYLNTRIYNDPTVAGKNVYKDGTMLSGDKYDISGEKELVEIDSINTLITTSRISLSNISVYSYNIRLKAIEVSLLNSFHNIWFGNGAGTSQNLLPGMATEYDNSIDNNSGKYYWMSVEGTIGEPAHNNISVIDSHNLFLTELFNVGIVGFISLLILVFMIMYEHIKIIIYNNQHNVGYILLFATVSSLLAHRMTASYVVIPYLWFLLGLSLGIINIENRESKKISEYKEIS